MEYVKPQPIYIGNSDESAKLYQLEGQRADIIEKIADEWLRLMEIPLTSESKWGRAFPQVLFETLDGFDIQAADLAAVAYLEMRGYVVGAAPEVVHGTVTRR